MQKNADFAISEIAKRGYDETKKRVFAYIYV